MFCKLFNYATGLCVFSYWFVGILNILNVFYVPIEIIICSSVPFFLSMYITLINFFKLNYPWKIGWILLGYDVYLFLYIAGFDMLIFQKAFTSMFMREFHLQFSSFEMSFSIRLGWILKMIVKCSFFSYSQENVVQHWCYFFLKHQRELTH